MLLPPTPSSRGEEGDDSKNPPPYLKVRRGWGEDFLITKTAPHFCGTVGLTYET